MKTNRATFTLDDEAYAFLNEQGGRNKSAYLNALLRQEQERALAAQIAQDNLEEANDMEYQTLFKEWDNADLMTIDDENL